MKTRKRKAARYLYSKRILVTSAVALLICAITTSVCLRLTNQNLIESHNAETYAKLVLVEEALNEKIMSAYAGAIFMLSDEAVQSIGSLREGPITARDYIRLLEASRNIQKRRIAQDVIFEYALIFENRSMLTLTSSRILHNLKFEYDANLFACEDLPYEEFVGEYVAARRRPGERYRYYPARLMRSADRGEREVIIYSFINSVGLSPNQPVSMLMIDVDGILEQVRPLLADEGGQVAISDSFGNLLYRSGERTFAREELDASQAKLADGYLLSANADGTTDLSLHIYVPNSWVANSTAPLMALVRIFLFTALFLVIGIALYGVVTSSRHMMRVASSLDMEPPTQFTSMGEIEGEIERVCLNNRQMSGALASLRPAIRAGILESMYKGGILSADDARLAPEIYDLLPERYHCCVLSWQGAGEGEADGILRRATALLSRFYIGEFIHPCSIRSVAFIADDEALDLALMENIVLRLDEDTDALVSMAVGGAQSGPSGVYTSYIEALSAQTNLQEHSVNRVICFQEEEGEASEYCFTLDQMLKLALSVDSGDKPSMCALMSAIYERNFCNRKFSDDDIARFNHDMSFVHAKCSESARRGGAQPPSMSRDGLPALWTRQSLYESYRDLFSNMIDAVTAARSTQKNAMFEGIKRYIDENFGSEEMSLKLVGARFGITDKYASMLFKANTGINFSQYVENKRLDVAVDYLNGTELSISEIQERCGYSTPSTFYKAFKRRYGLSPSEYRGAGASASAP